MPAHWEALLKDHERLDIQPVDLINAAVEYFKWCDENPIEGKETLKSGKEAGKKIDTEYTRPYSVKGLCLHCGITEEYIRDIRNTKDRDSDWYIAMSRILYVIYLQNAELATVGVYNPIFVSRLLNIGQEDVPTSSIKVEIIGDNLKLSNSENEILEKLELENQDGKIIDFEKS